MWPAVWEEVLWELSHRARAFPAKGSEIDAIPSPVAFYEELLSQSCRAEKRVYLSCLYLGTGEYEKNLVQTLSQRVKAVPKLKVNVLLDYNRGHSNL